MKNNKPIITPHLGMRIKIALPTKWCQVTSDSPYQWLKGKIIEIPNEDTIVINVKSKNVGKIVQMMCFRDKETKTFRKIIECQGRK